MLALELSIVAILIAINGLLSMSELAVVSSRPARLRVLVEQGVKGARRALVLHADPGRFLSTVQIGITLVGVLSGTFSGATLGLRLTHWLLVEGLPPVAAEAIGVGSVVAAITYASLIVGELVPKQIALRNPEAVAARVAPAMTLLAKVSSPLVFLLALSGKAVLRLMGHKDGPEQKVTDEELKSIIAEAESAGVLESDERRMISGVMRLGNRAVRGVMTPRTEVEWIDLSMPAAEAREILMASKHSRLPVGEDIDSLGGVILSREMLAAMIAGKALDIRAHVRTAPIVYDNSDALDVLAVLQKAEVPMGLVHDEYGHFEGVVTPADILEAIVGASAVDGDPRDPAVVRREDGSWLIAGHLPADEMADHLGLRLPESRDYQTAAGFMLANFQHLPVTGDRFDASGWRFEVVDMDGRRIDKILACRPPTARRPEMT
jgi:putative hemolysin